MRVSEIQTMFDYDRWATGRILQAAGALTPEEFAAPSPLGGPGVRDTLIHLVDAMLGWRLRWEGQADEDLQPDQFESLAAVSDRWDAEVAALRSFVGRLSDEDLQRPVRTLQLWQTLLHLVNHGTQHRSEVAMLLTHYGHSPDDLDLSWYLRDFQGRTE